MRPCAVFQGAIIMEYLILLVCSIALCAALYMMMRGLTRRVPSCPTVIAAEARPAHESMLTCSCEEWRRERARFRQGDPRRLCVHLCARLAGDTLRLPEVLRPFASLVILMAEEGRGVPCAPPAFAFVLGDSGYLVTMEKNAYPSATVYVGRGRHVFNVAQGSWEEGGAPPFAADIGNLIQAEIRRRLAREREKARTREAPES